MYYGTVARMRVKAGLEERMAALGREWETIRIPGMLASYVLASDSDPRELYLTAVFESKEAYVANAGSPEQHARYLALRELLDADPEWHDGSFVSRWTPS
jgi:quinol monooxygenase YgiN